MKFAIALFLALFHLFAPIACDEPVSRSFAEMQEEVMQEEADYSFGDQILKMLFALATIVSLILLTAWLMRRLSKNRTRYGNHSHHIKVIERRPIGPKTTLYLLDIMGQGVVIADAPGGVRTLYELPPGVGLAALQQPSDSPVPKPKFVDIFSKLGKKPC
jgi:flagellar biogenesis protein FliO